jgi:hypothetical protein
MHGLSTTVGDAGPERENVPPHAIPETLVRELSGGAPTPAQQATLDRVAATDWRTTALVLGDAADEAFAARAIELGAICGIGFGNFYAFVGHPAHGVVRYANASKGRPPEQVESIVSVPEHFAELIDPAALPPPLDADKALALIDAFLAVAPFAFRCPAAAQVPPHLSAMDGAIRTTQLANPGAACPSNAFYRRVFAESGLRFLFGTSANVSHLVTHHAEEPAHWKIAGLQADFGDRPGYIFLRHADEAAALARFPGVRPSSTSVIALHRAESDAEGRPALVLERWGNLDLPPMREILARFGFGLIRAPTAQTRLPAHTYPA